MSAYIKTYKPQTGNLIPTHYNIDFSICNTFVTTLVLFIIIFLFVGACWLCWCYTRAYDEKIKLSQLLIFLFFKHSQFFIPNSTNAPTKKNGGLVRPNNYKVIIDSSPQIFLIFILKGFFSNGILPFQNSFVFTPFIVT